MNMGLVCIEKRTVWKAEEINLLFAGFPTPVEQHVNDRNQTKRYDESLSLEVGRGIIYAHWAVSMSARIWESIPFSLDQIGIH